VGDYFVRVPGKPHADAASLGRILSLLGKVVAIPGNPKPKVPDVEVQRLLQFRGVDLPKTYIRCSTPNSAAYKSIGKHAYRPPLEIDMARWAKVWTWMVKFFQPFLGNSKVKTFDDIINEVDNTGSPGWPWCMKFSSKHDFYQQERAYCENEWSNGHLRMWQTFTQVTVKGELREYDKVLNDNLRTILPVCAVNTMKGQRLFRDMQQRHSAANLFCDTAIGADIFHGGTNRIAAKWAKFPFGVSYDIEACDSNLFEFFLMTLADFKFAMLAPIFQTKDNYRRIIHYYVQICKTPLVMPDGWVFEKGPFGSGGNLTGHVCTAFDNDMFAKFLEFWSWAEDPLATLGEYLAFCSPLGLADDRTWTQKIEDQRMTPDRHAYIVRRDFGVTLTSTCWSMVPWEQLNFLSFNLEWDDEYQMFFHAPHTDRILCSLQWPKGNKEPVKILARLLNIRIATWGNHTLRPIIAQLFWDYVDFHDRSYTYDPMWIAIKRAYYTDRELGIFYSGEEFGSRPLVSTIHSSEYAVRAVSQTPERITSFLEESFRQPIKLTDPSKAHWGAAGRAATHLVNYAAKPLGAFAEAAGSAVVRNFGNPFLSRKENSQRDLERQYPLPDRLQHSITTERLRSATKRAETLVGLKMPPKGSKKIKSSLKQAKKAIQKAERKVSFKGSKKGRSRKGKKRKSKKGNRGYQMKTGKNNKFGVGASYFSFQRAQFKGEDLWVPIQLTGNDGTKTSVGQDQPGTIIISQKISPTNWIPNSRAQRLVSLFEQQRFVELWIGFKSSMAPGNVGGKLRIFYESDMDDVLPANYAAPSGSALSNWLIHPGKSWDIAHKGTQWFKVPVHLCKGPMGGWFFVDAVGVHTDAERFGGQIAIAIEEQWNTIGSSGVIPAQSSNPFTSVGNLLIKYTIGVQTAAEEDISAGGMNRLQLSTTTAPRYANPTNANTSLYPQQTVLVQTNAVQIVANPITTGNTFWQAYAGFSNNIAFPMYVLNNSSNNRDIFFFAEPGLYYFHWLVNIYQQADYGAAATPTGPSNLQHFGAGPGSVSDVDQCLMVGSTTGSSSGPYVSGFLSVIDPINDGFGITWTNGSGSATYTGSSSNRLLQLNVFQIAPTITGALKKMTLERRTEFLGQYMTKLQGQPFKSWRNPIEMKTSVRDEILQVLSSPDQLRKILQLQKDDDKESLDVTAFQPSQAPAKVTLPECKDCALYFSGMCHKCLRQAHDLDHNAMDERWLPCDDCRSRTDFNPLNPAARALLDDLRSKARAGRDKWVKLATTSTT